MDRRAFFRRARRAAPRLAHATAPADLAPFTGDWTARHAAHLVRRTHFGASRADTVAAVVRGQTGGAAAAAGAIVDAALARPLPDAPRWAGSLTSGDANTQRLYEWQRAWYAEMAEGGLREKMALFWHDHFATGHGVYTHAAFAVDYLTFLRERAVGPFKPLVQGIGKRPAMLRYLDNDTNRAGEINENYAREVLELFSLGIDGPDGTPNYTQSDVREAARALTGWVVNEGRVRGEFQAARHDAGPKTVLGKTGAWDADDVVDLVFAERGEAAAHFLAGKLYAWFVHPVPNPAVVAALADVLRANGFDVGVALRSLLASAHFYSDAVVGARLKSPMELLVGLVRELGVSPSGAVLEQFRVASQSMGQEVLDPPSVEGWPGYDDALEYRAWLTTGTVPERRAVADDALFGGGAFGVYDPLPLVEQVSDKYDPYRIARDLAAHLLAAPLSDADADALADETVLDGAPASYTRDERRGFWTEIVLSTDGAARQRLRLLLSALLDLPEYQLV